MIVFNEKTYVEELLERNKFTQKKWYDMQLIACYYRERGYNDEQIRATLNNLGIKNFKNFIPTQSSIVKCVDNVIKKSKTRKLKVAKNIIITDEELATILKEENKKCQKLMFVYLVLAKYYMSLNHANDYYVGCEDNDIFKLCKMYIKKQDKLDFMHYLTKKGYITPTLSMSSVVNYVNENGKIIMEFIPDENMVYNFERYLGDTKIFNCSICGTLIKKISNHQKYCKKCAEEIKNKTINF